MTKAELLVRHFVRCCRGLLIRPTGLASSFRIGYRPAPLSRRRWTAGARMLLREGRT